MRNAVLVEIKQDERGAVGIFVGVDDRGLALEIGIMGGDDDRPVWLVIHVMPYRFRGE